MAVPLLNFSKGEIAPALYGRIDVAQYNAALKTARNFIVKKYGGVTFRPGTRVVGEVNDPSLPVRLVEFQFSIEQGYVLVMGQGHFQPVANGGFVVEQDTQITAISKEEEATLTIPFHGYAEGDRLFLNGIQGMTELNGRVARVLSVPDGNTIIIDVDTTSFSDFLSSTGTLNAAPPPPPPPPPPVPPPPTPPAPPDTGGGGGDDYDWIDRGVPREVQP